MEIYSSNGRPAFNTIGWMTSTNGHMKPDIDQRSPDSAFGSCELDQSFDSQSSSHHGNGSKYLTLARTKVPFTVLSPVPFLQSNNLSAGVKVQHFTDKEKKAWIHQRSDRGFIRLFDPGSDLKVSVVVPCSLSTTARDVCVKLGLTPNCLHVQFNGDRVRRLNEKDKPLAIQNDYLNAIGLEQTERQQTVGDNVSLGFMIRFFSGRPEFEENLVTQSLSAFCMIRRGRMFQHWSHRLCVFSASKILIYPNLDRHGQPEVVCLSRARVEEVMSRSRGRCMRIAVPLGRKPAYTIYFSFDSLVDLGLWLSTCSKAASTVPSVSDLSKMHLERIPDQVFAMGSERLITQLNLRKNNLRERSSLLHLDALSRGWLDDLPKLQSLRSLNLSDNDLQHFPKAILELPALTELALAGNKLANLPPEINKLNTLKIINLQNNRLSWLPSELADCRSLSSLDLSFNRFSAVPEVICRITNLTHWQLAGNNIEFLRLDSALYCAPHLKKVDLRRNRLLLPEVIPLGCFQNITKLDLRDNARFTEIDLRALGTLQILNCDRMELKDLMLNGTNIVSLHASNNKLQSITIMPPPHNLKVLDLSHNQLKYLPDWLTELRNIEKVVADHNLIGALPQRMFTNVTNLKVLVLNHNLIHELPSQIENCYIEVLHLHHNKLHELPVEFLASTHKLRFLNLSQNFLTALPPLNPFQDLNKVQHLVASANCLDDGVIDVISGYRRLKIVDLAYNRIRYIDNRSIERLQFLEEINISGNRLAKFPSSLVHLPNVRVLRAHSNCLTVVPDLSACCSLRLLDLANNCIQSVDTNKLMAPQLKHLDLSCNYDLRLDKYEIDRCKTEKIVSWIEMAEDNLTESSLDVAADVPWQVGFTETSGERNKLCVAQIRLPIFKYEPGRQCGVGGLFGMVDGGLNDEIPIQMESALPELIRAELKADGTGTDYLKYCMLSAHQSLQAAGQKMRASSALCHLWPKTTAGDPSDANNYLLNVANVGHTKAVLCRRGRPLVVTENTVFSCRSKANSTEYERVRAAGGILTENNEINGITPCSRQLGCGFLYPSVIPDPYVSCTQMCEEDEFLIIANDGFWKLMSPTETVRRVRPISNCVLAAKHLQDMAQSYGCTENLSVLVLRFYFTQAPDPPISRAPSCRLGQAQSEINLLDVAETASLDSDVQSEPRGPVKEKPNYYFEYKKKLKQLERQSQQSSASSSLLSLDQPPEAAAHGSLLELDPVSLADETFQNEVVVPRLINHSFNEDVKQNIVPNGIGAVFCDGAPSYSVGPALGRTIARYGLEEEADEARFQLVGTWRGREKTKAQPAGTSRARFEAARQLLIEKLDMNAPQNTRTNKHLVKF